MATAISRFRDRRQAGRVLAPHLSGYSGRNDVVVLGLPRGGVPVAFEVAQLLRAPLGVFIVRKLGVPGHEELAMGAIAAGGIRVVDWETVAVLGVSRVELDRVIQKEEQELGRRERLYHGEVPRPDLSGKIVIVVDDGLATGATMRVVVTALRERSPARVVVAVPIAAPDTCQSLREVADETVCAITPEPFIAVGVWYRDFSETTDDEVRGLLRAAAGEGIQDQPVGERAPLPAQRH
jgi:putative phosphoribosyl transferase